MVPAYEESPGRDRVTSQAKDATCSALPTNGGVGLQRQRALRARHLVSIAEKFRYCRQLEVNLAATTWRCVNANADLRQCCTGATLYELLTRNCASRKLECVDGAQDAGDVDREGDRTVVDLSE